ncbi:NAD(P)/FAD-dependent oxidoreductase [Nocardia sp. NPDC052566]|uniref:NAD(P)/FAD-dependent oxidoreductase n=1 Tax=Nocardia sp. NPDC052566 TaxID=3364330 RepID=UPI0037CA0F61
MNDVGNEYDVIVIGGGPAGSATAGLLAKKGRRVLLLEKQKFPRYHIGESLLTGAIPALEELGIFDRIPHLGGAVKKYGGTLRWGADKGTWDFRFADGSPYEYAFQLRRADFDALLLARARELGVEVIEEASVAAPILDGDRVTGVSYGTRAAPGVCTAGARFTVDASGQAAVFGRWFDMITWNEDFRNMATWAYFQGAERYEGTKRGDIVTEHTDNGWFWCIPLSDGTTSVGHVSQMARSGKSRQEMADLFYAELAETTEVSRLLRHAFRASEFRNTKDWSYTCDRIHGSGWALVGDAAAFVDPLLSTGMTLGLRAARGLVAAVDTTLTDPAAGAAAMNRYEENYRRVITQILTFVRFFYETKHHKEDYWAKAQDIIDPDRLRPRIRDFVTVMSGLNGLFATEDEKQQYALLKERIAQRILSAAE